MFVSAGHVILHFLPLIGHNLLLAVLPVWVWKWLLQKRPLLHLGPNVITDRTFITLGFKMLIRMGLSWSIRGNTKTLENDRTARCGRVSWTRCAYYKHTRQRYFLSSFSSRCVFDSKTMWMRFRFDSLSRAFHGFSIKTPSGISEDERPKQFETYDFKRKCIIEDGA